MIFAHRGVHSSGADENTLPSFGRALAAMDGFECDVRLSRDREPFIVHDATLSRTHNVSRRVCDMDSRELRGIGVPTPEAVLSLVSEHEGGIVVFDLKVDPQSAMEKILSAARRLQVDRQRIMFLVGKKVTSRPRGCRVLRAVDFSFRAHRQTDGVACKFDGSAANRRCIDRLLWGGYHVNLYAPRAENVDRMMRLYGTVGDGRAVSMTVSVSDRRAHLSGDPRKGGASSSSSSSSWMKKCNFDRRTLAFANAPS